VQLSRGVVNYRLAGPEGALPIVLVHGLNANIASNAGVSNVFAERGFRVLSYDLYGCGLSASPWGKLDLNLYANQLRELIESVLPGDTPVCLFGYCIGGVVAAEYALANPGRVSRLLLVAPCGFVPRSAAPCQKLLFGCIRKQCQGCCFMCALTGMATCCSCPIRRYIRKKGVLDMMSPDVRDADQFIEYSRKNTERCAWAMPRSLINYVRGLRSLPMWREDYAERYVKLAQMPLPVMFLWGDDDCVMPFNKAVNLVAEIFGPKDFSCIVIPGGGHGIILEDCQQVCDYSLAWFSDSKDPSWLQCLATTSLTPSWQMQQQTQARPPAAQMIGVSQP